LKLFAAYDNKLYFTDNTTFLAAYDASDGHELWYNSMPPQGNGGVDVKNRLLVDLLYTYDIDTGKLIGRKKVLKHHPCVYIRAISDGLVFTNEYCDGPYIVAYDNLTGEQLWSAGANDGSGLDVNLFVAGDLLISAIDGKPEVIARNKYTGEIVWQFSYRDGGELHDGSIFCQDDMLFVVDTDKIYIYGYGEHHDESSVHSP
jgi:outer membrane protein assembly factor BamB